MLCRIAEEFGGVRTAYYYDILQRQKLAKSLQNSSGVDITAFLNKVDHETLKDAQAKYDAKAREAGRDQARGSKGAGKSEMDGGAGPYERRGERKSRSPRRRQMSGGQRWESMQKGGGKGNGASYLGGGSRGSSGGQESRPWHGPSSHHGQQRR